MSTSETKYLTPIRPSNSEISSKNKPSNSRPKVVTSTPRKGPTRNSQFPYSDDLMLEVNDGDAEALPHVHKGHYFNVMNVFGIGGGKCEYSVVNSTVDASFYTPVKQQKRDRKGTILFFIYNYWCNVIVLSFSGY